LEPTATAAGLVPLVIGIVEIAKETGLPGRFAPVCSLVLGILAGIALQFIGSASGVAFTGPVIANGLYAGVGMGLAASGIYSGVQAFTSPKLMTFASTVESISGLGAPADPPVASDPVDSAAPAADPAPAA
jgi:hypothetical protein